MSAFSSQSATVLQEHFHGLQGFSFIIKRKKPWVGLGTCARFPSALARAFKNDIETRTSAYPFTGTWSVFRTVNPFTSQHRIARRLPGFR
jgi:hypothetical protein